MTDQNWQKGHAYRMKTDANYRARQANKTTTNQARQKLIILGTPKCSSRATSAHDGPFEVHHVGGDLTGKRGMKVMCRRHNREAAGQKNDDGNHPGGS